jgi:hypothetical protein
VWSSEVPYSRNDRCQQTRTRLARIRPSEQEFKCIQCHQYVSCAPIIAGVQNRNHCPACLWSRHLDWFEAGDRLSGCRAAMEPVGLTTKRSKNKYASERDGELMLIHRCTGCEKIVINRIAADDSAAAILEIFDSSCTAGAVLHTELDTNGVSMLTAHDRDHVWRRLFGDSLVGVQQGVMLSAE